MITFSFSHRNKLQFKICSNRKQLYKTEKYFTILWFLLYFLVSKSVFSCIFHIRHIKMLYNYLDLVMFCHIFYLNNMTLKSGVRSLA